MRISSAVGVGDGVGKGPFEGGGDMAADEDADEPGAELEPEDDSRDDGADAVTLYSVCAGWCSISASNGGKTPGPGFLAWISGSDHLSSSPGLRPSI